MIAALAEQTKKEYHQQKQLFYMFPEISDTATVYREIADGDLVLTVLNDW